MTAAAGTNRRRRIRGAVWLCAATAGALLAGCGAGTGSGAVAIGKPVPQIQEAAIAGGPISLRALRGRWVVVNFFATWCEPCRQEYPQLARFAAQEKATVQVVGVVYEDQSADALHFHRSEGGTWPIVADPTGRISSQYLVSALPQSFVIDPSGRLADRIFGGVTVDKLDRAVAGQKGTL